MHSMTAKNRFAFSSLSRTSLLAALLVGTTSLSACAVKQPLAIQSTGQPVAAESTISLVEMADGSAQQNLIQAAFAKAMARHSLTIAPGAPLLAEIVATERPAQLGLAKDTSEVDWNSEPRKQHWLDKCEAKTLRGTLVITERSSGAIQYRGTGEIIDCGFEAADYDRMAERLVADAMGKGGA